MGADYVPIVTDQIWAEERTKHQLHGAVAPVVPIVPDAAGHKWYKEIMRKELVCFEGALSDLV